MNHFFLAFTLALYAPISAGILFPNILVSLFIVFEKLFDVWSTNYIVGRKGGVEKDPLTRLFIKITGTLQRGMAVDFVLCTAVAWFGYTDSRILFGIATYYLILMIRQYGQLKQSQPK